MAKGPRKPRKSAPGAPACLPTCEGDIHDPRCPKILAELERSVARASAPASPRAPQSSGPAEGAASAASGGEGGDPLAGLTPKQRLFALEYLVDHNASAAYRRAGFSPKHANSEADKLKRHPAIAAFIAAHDRDVEQRLGLTVERLDEETARVAFSDPDEFEVLADLPENLRRAVSGLKIRELYDDKGKEIGRVVEVKFHDKVAALRLGYQRKGALVDKHDIKLQGPQKVSIRIGFERKRTAPAATPTPEK